MNQQSEHSLVWPLVGLASVMLTTAIIVFFAKRNPEKFNRGNPFSPGGIKNTKIRNAVLIIVAVVSLAQVVILIFRKS